MKTVNGYVELKPEYHVGDISVTVCCKESEQTYAFAILELLAASKYVNVQISKELLNKQMIGGIT